MSSPAAVLGNHVPVTTCTELQGLCQPAFLHGILQQKSAFPPTRKRPEVTLSAPWPSWALHHILFIIIRVCIPTQTWACRDPTVLHAGAPADTAGLQPACLLEAPLTLSTREIKLAAAFFFSLGFFVVVVSPRELLQTLPAQLGSLSLPLAALPGSFLPMYSLLLYTRMLSLPPPPLLFFFISTFSFKINISLFPSLSIQSRVWSQTTAPIPLSQSPYLLLPSCLLLGGGVPLSPHCSNAHLWYDCASLCVRD